MTTRNKFDDAYVIGYSNGYHHDGYMNEYNKKTQPQYHIKYKHGYEAGESLRVKDADECTRHLV